MTPAIIIAAVVLALLSISAAPAIVYLNGPSAFFP